MSGRGSWQWRNVLKRPSHSFSETMAMVSAQEGKDSEEFGSDSSKFADEVEAQATAELIGNLRLMVNAPDFSDVVFVCNDEKQIHASRMLLAGRSEVLKSMLMNGMAESNLSRIELPEISSPVLLSVLEFLYTGALVDCPPTSWRMACEVVIASRFFLLPTLETITRKFMRAQISFVRMDLPKAACLLTEAMELKAVSGDGDVNLTELVAILSSNWSASIFVQNLSEEAFRYLLATTKAKNGDDYELSFKEYLRFRQVIRWWVHQSERHPFRAEEILNAFAPDEESALSLCKKLDHLQKIESPLEDAEEIFSVSAPDEKRALSIGRNQNDHERGESGESPLEYDGVLRQNSDSFQLDEESRDSVIRLLSNIDFRWIHPTLLTKVVEPLKVVPSAEILAAFRFHALRRPAIYKTLECIWELGESYIALEKGYVVHKIGNKIGLAVMMEAMARSYGVYQWRVFIQIVPEDFCELGFLYYGGGVGAEKSKFNDEKLSDLRLSDLYRARVLNFQKTCATVNWEGAGGRTDWKVLVHSPYTMIAFFNYDASEHTCSLSINGQELGVIWKDLPNAVYYPAVSLGTSNKGRARIELVSGFDIF